ncbi:protein SMG5 [Copidosoma floridanum]|uniref:protein SMG5 n=1 Tax=Copidosoma floridanum TaxID=29053 RepID=UPI0006C9A9B8|nr:protein SMG5 [Copidosoma floridanum]
MKKIYNIGADIRSGDGLETTRRLYRNITEIAKKLEEQKSRALTVIDVFTPSGEALRSKLRDYCERLIIDDPVNHVQKTEELLWRRGFYDIVSIAKKLRKENVWNETEKAFLSAHLSVGVGFYHHLILRLQLEFELELTSIIDFAYPSKKGLIQMEKSLSSKKVHSTDAKKCVSHFIHRSLICLGDLARYRLDLDPSWDPQIATRYYKMAIVLNTKYGMPHNQLGTVASNKNYGLDAVYYYMRSLLCAEPFELAEGNLKRTIIVHSLNGKEKCSTHSCVARLLLLLQLWDNSSTNIDKINEESQILLRDIENCLNVEKCKNTNHEAAENEDSIEKYLSHYKVEETNYLNDDMMFKVIVICLMKIFKLQQKTPTEVHGVIALLLAVFSQLLQFVTIRLQESLLDMSIAEVECNGTDNAKEIIENENTIENTEKTDNEKSIEFKNSLDCDPKTPKENNGKFEVNGNYKKKKSKNLLTKLRRPRIRRNSSDSDASDGEGMAAGSSSEDLNSDITENEEDVISDDNALSEDEVMSEDVSEDEASLNKKDTKDEDNINGKAVIEEKFVQENENENDKDDENKCGINESNLKNSNNLTNFNNSYDENNTVANKTLACVAQKEKQKLDLIKVLQVLAEEKMLVSIKVCCDWLQGNQNIIKTCARGSKSLLERLITLFNLINLDSQELLNKWDQDLEIFSCMAKVKEVADITPLPEDIDLRGLKFFEDTHKGIDWDVVRRKKITNTEETLLRALKIVKFGHYLSSIQESGIIFDSNKGLFIESKLDSPKAKENQSDAKNLELELDHSKGKMMRHMGKLWLKAEVHALENRLYHRLMSPYLVPDHEAFSRFMPVIKHLVYAKKFIVVVPSIVISALDEMKRMSSHAREATRWLETQLQRGSRFLRAQRPHEKLPLPFIKGPKPKDKEAWLYFHIVECCHYLTQQSQSGGTEIPVVTLLTGIDDKKTFTFSPDALAKSAGVNFEHIGAFHAKWKLSIKSHG